MLEQANKLTSIEVIGRKILKTLYQKCATI
jgi:hypothetical protein